MAEVLESIRGKEVVVSGDFRDLGYTKGELRLLALRTGAVRAIEDVTARTNVFVKGTSPRYKFVKSGSREAEVARLQRSGRDIVMVRGTDFLRLLLDGTPPPTLLPADPACEV